MGAAKELGVRSTPIPGLLVIDLAVHEDARGWFKENWQRQKLLELGLPDFGPVQNNISFNEAVGVTRGMHAEPWDKYISVASGRVFAAWVDLREGQSFGNVFSIEIDPSIAVFVPRGVANGFQTLEADTAYTYLVNDHWNPQARYDFVNIADPQLGITWPLALEHAIISEKDQNHPLLREQSPIPPRGILIVGASGQVGCALREVMADAVFLTREDFDLSNEENWSRVDWSSFHTVINAAAYTAVDAAETAQGRQSAWQVNAVAVQRLAAICRNHGITLVHLSSDYVFDGTKVGAYLETDPLTPLGVYAQSKAAGDIAAMSCPRHYIIRTSWVVGHGKNFVRTMEQLAHEGISPAVIADQFGRPTFAIEIARAVQHLLLSGSAFGTYNVTNSGMLTSWYELAQEVFEILGYDRGLIRPVTAAEYAAGQNPWAPRPANSALSIDKIRKCGFEPADWRTALTDYFR